MEIEKKGGLALMLNMWVLLAYLWQSPRTAILTGAGWRKAAFILSIHSGVSLLQSLKKKEKQQIVVSEIVREVCVSFLNSIVLLQSC